MRYYSLRGPEPRFLSLPSLGWSGTDRPEPSVREAALALISERGTLRAPLRAESFLRGLVDNSADVSQPFYRLLVLTDPEQRPAVVLGIGVLAPDYDAYDFFALAARDGEWAEKGFIAWRAWLTTAGARMARVELDSPHEELGSRLRLHGYEPCGRLRDFYAPGEDQVILAWERR